MSLTLEIVGPQAAQLGAAAHKTFFDAGGSIGRANTNDWVIPDAYVSGQHARVHFHDGRYFLEDTSTNGVFVKNPGNRLPKGQQYPLQSGDRVFIDAYEIKVTVTAESRAGDSNPAGESLFEAVSKHQQAAHVSTAVLEANSGKSNADRRGMTNHEIPVDLTIPLPEPSDAIADALMEIDFDPFGNDVAAVAPQPVKQATAAAAKPNKKVMPRPAAATADSSPSLNQSADIRALLASAGIADSNITPEMTENFGQIFQVVIAGVMEILRSREQLKDEFGMRHTSFKPADNNPLKFSANVEDALHNLLVKRNAAYLNTVDAFEDAFRDIQHHEQAMLEGMRAAFNALLQTFNPDNLQVRFNKEVKHGAIWTVPIKLRYWELYRDLFRNLTKDSTNSFRNLFGEEFSRAYSEQMDQFKAKDKH